MYDGDWNKDGVWNGYDEDINSEQPQTEEDAQEIEEKKEPEQFKKINIRVVGIGGAGTNTVKRITERIDKIADYGDDDGLSDDEFMEKVSFYAVSTDYQTLEGLHADSLVIGKKTARGMGAGADPELGKHAAEESADDIRKICEGVNLMFIVAGMGGGTGTGAAPVVAKIAKQAGCLTVAVVTRPFYFEGAKRDENARKGIDELTKAVDAIMVVPNDKLVKSVNSPSKGETNTKLQDAFTKTDMLIKQFIAGITDIITNHSLINLDFADLRTVIENKGVMHIGIGVDNNDKKRVLNAVMSAVSNPLLETTIKGAKNVLLYISGGSDIAIEEINEAASMVRGAVNQDANIIFGANINPGAHQYIKIMIIATGLDKNPEGTSRDSNTRKALDLIMNNEPREAAKPARQNAAEENEEKKVPVYDDDDLPLFARVKK